MIKKKVSIYIPAYNAENTIGDSILSVKNQIYKFDEILVINDNSTDDTDKILNELSDIKIINNLENKGLGFNRNLGMKESSNELVACIDADVVLDKHWLEVMIKNFNEKNDTICGGRMDEKLISNKYNLWRAKYYSQNWGKEDIENPPFLFGCNTIQHKSLWKEVGGYDESLLTNGEDVDYANKIKNSKKFKLKYCANALSEHLQNDNLITLSNRVWRYHSFGYKIKQPSIIKTIKLSIKQIKFFVKRSLKNLASFEFSFIKINFVVLLKFIVLEHKYYKKNKK